MHNLEQVTTREIPVMSEEQFTDYLTNATKSKGDDNTKGENTRKLDKLFLSTFEATKVFKSVRRAIRRGHVAVNGVIYPKRPFSNKKVTKGRKLNELKKKIYGELKASRSIA